MKNGVADVRNFILKHRFTRIAAEKMDIQVGVKIV
jgi:hypothetical protein